MMNFRFAIVIVLLLHLIGLLSCNPSDNSDNRFTSADLNADFDQLYNLIRTRHPLTFTDLQRFQDVVSTQRQKIEDSLSLFKFYRILAPVVASVGCSHTRLSFSDKIYEDLMTNGKFFPIDVEIIDSNLYISENYSDENDIKRGDRIISINSIPADSVLQVIMDAIYADGYNYTYKKFVMESEFRTLFYILIDSSHTFNLTIFDRESKQEKSYSIRAKTNLEIRTRKHNHADSNFINHEINFYIKPEENYAYLRIYFFEFYDDSQKSFINPIDSIFKLLKENNIGSLILDLRHNDGGNAYLAVELLKYLVPENFKYFSQQSAPLLNDLKKEQSVSGNRFTGDLYVLVDGGCASTTTHMLSHLRNQKQGIFIGERTGGSYICNGGFREYKLKKTGINLLLPHATFITAVSSMESDFYIAPDIAVERTPDDLRNNRDAVLDKALELIDSTIQENR